MRFTLDQLAVLDAIDRLGSFRAAGAALHRVTSAVSYAVRSLEESVGLRLFDRSGHRARLTASGQAFLAEARALLIQARKLERLADQLGRGWEPQIAIVVDGVLPRGPIMRALLHFSSHELPTRVEVMVEYLAGVQQRFEREQADLMLALDFQRHPDYVAAALPPVTMLLLAQRDHPLAGAGSVDREALAQHVELVVADSSPDSHLRPHRLRLGSPHLMRLSDFLSKREAILSGVGFGWLPLHLVQEPLATGELVRLPFEEGDRFDFQPHLVRRRDAHLGPAVRLVLDLLAEAPAEA